MSRKKTVFVGLSGGVDSSVAALRLQRQGFTVVGVFIKVWHPDFMVCNWEQERLDAMRVAAHLEIPFLTCDAEERYKQEVADYFIGEYKAGRTPNPDVMCNKAVKFGAFIDFAQKHDADFIATGHYAQKKNNALFRGVDQNKDQTYFLWTLNEAQLNYTLFPVGDTPKEQIRIEAAAAKLPVASKRDSQGICFLGHVDIPEFIGHYVDLEPGNVLSENGMIIGKHKGALVYTFGQRHGFTISNQDTSRAGLYVTGKDLESNTITVSTETQKVTPDDSILLSNTILRAEINPDKTYTVQFRYRQEPIPAKVHQVGTGLTVRCISTAEQPASGQSCVIYDDNHCLGGGIVA